MSAKVSNLENTKSQNVHLRYPRVRLYQPDETDVCISSLISSQPICAPAAMWDLFYDGKSREAP